MREASSHGLTGDQTTCHSPGQLQQAAKNRHGEETWHHSSGASLGRQCGHQQALCHSQALDRVLGRYLAKQTGSTYRIDRLQLCYSCHAQSFWGHSSSVWSELAAVCDCQGQILQLVLQLPAGRLPRAEQYTCVGMCCLQGKVSAHHVVNADSVLADSITPIIVGSVGLVGALLFKSSYLNHLQSSKEVSSGCCLPLHPLC